MNITKKVCIYILVGLITITGTFTSFYKGAYAFEYVGGALAFEEAIKWLLASVGIISAGGMTADYWEQHGQEFEDYCTQQNITDTEVANWQLKLCEGILDKGSACWQAFKEWASTLTGSSSGGGSGEISSTAFGLYRSYMVDSLNLNPTLNESDFTSFTDNIVAAFGYYINTTPRIVYLCNNSGFNWYDGYIRAGDNSNFKYYVATLSSISSYHPVVTEYYININSTVTVYKWGDISFSSSNGSIFDIGYSAPIDSDFISVQPDVTDLDVISSPLPDTDAQEVSIPMPGVADSDNEASASAYDDIIDAVNNGQIELDDAITQIQDILKIIVYEEETEKIFPKPDNQEDQEDLDDKINQNKDNMAFTLGGLENVFPFCIPWDIYAFMSLLRADPVPPKVELPFPNPLDPENPWIVEVDFADWDDGMRVVRLAEDFLFIIGLAVLTRSLIGAGGGDG